MGNERNPLFNDKVLIIIVISIIAIFFIVVFYVNFFLQFKKERDYIKMEMGRTKGSEYRYWKKKLRKLYISKIPIVRRFFK